MKKKGGSSSLGKQSKHRRGATQKSSTQQCAASTSASAEVKNDTSPTKVELSQDVKRRRSVGGIVSSPAWSRKKASSKKASQFPATPEKKDDDDNQNEHDFQQDAPLEKKSHSAGSSGNIGSSPLTLTRWRRKKKRKEDVGKLLDCANASHEDDDDDNNGLLGKPRAQRSQSDTKVISQRALGDKKSDGGGKHRHRERKKTSSSSSSKKKRHSKSAIVSAKRSLKLSAPLLQLNDRVNADSDASLSSPRSMSPASSTLSSSWSWSSFSPLGSPESGNRNAALPDSSDDDESVHDGNDDDVEREREAKRRRREARARAAAAKPRKKRKQRRKKPSDGGDGDRQESAVAASSSSSLPPPASSSSSSLKLHLPEEAAGDAAIARHMIRKAKRRLSREVHRSGSEQPVSLAEAAASAAVAVSSSPSPPSQESAPQSSEASASSALPSAVTPLAPAVSADVCSPPTSARMSRRSPRGGFAPPPVRRSTSTSMLMASAEASLLCGVVGSLRKANSTMDATAHGGPPSPAATAVLRPQSPAERMQDGVPLSEDLQSWMAVNMAHAVRRSKSSSSASVRRGPASSGIERLHRRAHVFAMLPLLADIANAPEQRGVMLATLRECAVMLDFASDDIGGIMQKARLLKSAIGVVAGNSLRFRFDGDAELWQALRTVFEANLFVPLKPSDPMRATLPGEHDFLVQSRVVVLTTAADAFMPTGPMHAAAAAASSSSVSPASAAAALFPAVAQWDDASSSSSSSAAPCGGSWPHLRLVYALLVSFVRSRAWRTSDALHCFDAPFIAALLDRFNSAHEVERRAAMIVVHALYERFPRRQRMLVREHVSYALWAYTYEEGAHVGGIVELLEVFGSIISGYSVPLKDEHRQFLRRVLAPLINCPSLPSYAAQLSFCFAQFMLKAPEVAELIVMAMLRHWPLASSLKQLHLFDMLDAVLVSIDDDEFDAIVDPLVERLAKSIGSEHFKIAEAALGLLSSPSFIDLAIDFVDDLVLPVIAPTLERNVALHWHARIRVLSANALERLKYLSPANRARQRAVAVALASVNNSTSDPILVSKFQE
jgi:Protein phosphatase 2A regulatory B subunit (B56 family)